MNLPKHNSSTHSRTKMAVIKDEDANNIEIFRLSNFHQLEKLKGGVVVLMVEDR